MNRQVQKGMKEGNFQKEIAVMRKVKQNLLLKFVQKLIKC